MEYRDKILTFPVIESLDMNLRELYFPVGRQSDGGGGGKSLGLPHYRAIPTIKIQYIISLRQILGHVLSKMEQKIPNTKINMIQSQVVPIPSLLD